MNEIFNRSEIVSLHIPLTHETAQLVDHDFLAQFRNRVFLINTSRGKIVNHADLLMCIQQKKITGAALDVYENEKFETHTMQEQQQFQSLIKTGNVIFTPHIAGKSFESQRKIADVLLEKISKLL
jgi:D-3-phosphoglycerate dehydrogenase